MSRQRLRAVLGVLSSGLVLASLLPGPTAANATAPGIGAASVTPTVSALPPAAEGSLSSRFRGVNWADPRDNFNQDNNVPSGLSATDDYATTYRKSAQILTQFKTILHANAIRLGINQATVSGAWWQSYRAIVDAATDLQVNVILSVWPDRTFMLVEPNAIPNFYATYQKVIDDFGDHSNVYFDLVNEPQGYNDDPSGWVSGNPTNWRDVAAGWLEHFPQFPRSRVIIAGTGPGGDWYLGSVGNDHRLDGTLLELHVYSAFGLSFNTYQEWKDWFRGQIAGFESRTIVGEFGTTLNQGANFNGPRDGSNPVSYLYAVTDTIRELGLGTVFWPGYRQNDAWNMLTLSGAGSTADPYVGHVVNPSAFDRLQWAYGLGTPAATTVVSPASADFVANLDKSFTITTRGFPVAAITVAGQLPAGLRLTDRGDGTATISGRPRPRTAGTYHLTIQARQPDGTITSQALTVTVFSTAPTPRTAATGTPPSAPGDAVGTVTGTITDTRTGQAIPGGCAFLYPPDDAALRACADSNGKFQASNVPVGQYTVGFNDPRIDYRVQWFNGTGNGAATEASATPVTVTAGSTRAGVDALLLKVNDPPLVAGTGKISGRIVDNTTGRPAVGAELLVYAPPYGASAQGPKNFAYTAADGSFQVNGVAPGSYIVQLRDPRYRPQWFGGTADPGTARPVSVIVDGNARGVDYRAVPVAAPVD